MIKKKPDNSAAPSRQTRITRHRRIIMEELQVPNRHLTADEIYARLRRRIPNISLGTVYRNLELLVSSGKIKKLSIGSGPKQYDGGMHRHYHIRCIECGMVSDVSAEVFDDLNAGATVGVSGFDVIDHELEFTGLCNECKSRKRL